MKNKKHPLAILRELTGKPGREFAPMIGISYSRLAAIEGGRLEIPTETLSRTSALFGVSPDSLSGKSDTLLTWNGSPLTPQEIHEHLDRFHDSETFSQGWFDAYQTQAAALFKAAAKDPTKGRILLAEFTTWIERMRASLDLAEETEEELKWPSSFPPAKAQVTKTLKEIRDWYLDPERETEFIDCDMATEWRNFEVAHGKGWKSSTKILVVETKRPLWFPLYGPNKTMEGHAPIEGHIWRFTSETDFYAYQEYVGTLTAIGAIPVNAPRKMGLT